MVIFGIISKYLMLRMVEFYIKIELNNLYYSICCKYKIHNSFAGFNWNSVLLLIYIYIYPAVVFCVNCGVSQRNETLERGCSGERTTLIE